MSLEDSVSVEAIEPEFGTWFRTTLAPYVVHAMASLSCILMFVWVFHFRGGLGWTDEHLFNYHPLLQVIAFVLIIPESILLLRFSGFRRDVSKPAHASLHLIAVILAILGVSAAYKYKGDQSQPHFRSIHSWLGITVMVLLLSQWVVGYFIFYRARGSLKSKLAPAHINIGHVIVFFAALTVLTGIAERSIFTAACSSELSKECYTANFSALSAGVTFLALGIALTALKRAPSSMLPVHDPLLQEASSSIG